jgi:acetyl-CoA carboxylase biotin carboxyl carrier protein
MEGRTYMADTARTTPEDSLQKIERLAQVLDTRGLTKLEYDDDGCHILLEKQPPQLLAAGFGVAGPMGAGVPFAANHAPAADAAPAAGNAGSSQAATVIPEDGTTVKTPLVGVAYRSKKPGEPPFVEVGSTVKVGDVLCLIEAMKMFNEVTAPVSGRVTGIHFEDGVLVEFGAPLVTILPETEN